MNQYLPISDSALDADGMHPVRLPIPDRRLREEYRTPEAEILFIMNEIPFLLSDDDGDNEHTEEEDLF